MTSAHRKRRIVRTAVLVVGAPVLVLWLYCSSFVGAAWLYGAGVISDPLANGLCETVYYPLLTYDDDGGPDWLIDVAIEAYDLGYASIQ